MLLNIANEEAERFLTSLENVSINTTQERLNISRIQKIFLSFCLTAMAVIGSFCWEKMERASFGQYGARALSWMFRHSPIQWTNLWHTSIIKMVSMAGSKGVLVLDDTDRLRAKGTSKLFGVHKVKDKKTSGFSIAQNLVILLFVTEKLTIPVGFAFFRPDPAWKIWRENDIALRLKKVKKSERPKCPERNSDYPMKTTLGVKLVSEFKKLIPDADILVIDADAAYMTCPFISGCEAEYPDAQIISQIRKDWLVSDNKNRKQKPKRADDYFVKKPFIQTEVSLRGMPPRKITMVSARLFVKAQQRKLHIVALKYEGETEYRYLAATKLTWRAYDIVRAYGLRWLVEVAIEDWKGYCGWGKMAFQRGVDGACRGVILSFLVDHFLLSLPPQVEQLKHGYPVWTTGSMQRYLQALVIFAGVESILSAPDPKLLLQSLSENILSVLRFRPSDKHMSGHSIGDFKPDPALILKYRDV